MNSQNKPVLNISNSAYFANMFMLISFFQFSSNQVHEVYFCLASFASYMIAEYNVNLLNRNVANIKSNVYLQMFSLSLSAMTFGLFGFRLYYFVSVCYSILVGA